MGIVEWRVPPAHVCAALDGGIEGGIMGMFLVGGNEKNEGITVVGIERKAGGSTNVMRPESEWPLMVMTLAFGHVEEDAQAR
jgi:hypothetical protein